MSDVQIVQQFPPNIDKIREAFPAVKNLDGVIFAWGNAIYNPSNSYLPPWLIEHEKMHFLQQAGDPERWWDKYLSSAEFRLEQELEAHRVEYRVYCRFEKDRNRRAGYLREIAGRLASPMYGGVIPLGEAMRRIRT